MLKHLLQVACLTLALAGTVAHASVQANASGWEKYGELTFKVAEQTGVPVMDLISLTSMESGYNAKAKNGEGSSAAGLGAMTAGTYKTMVKRYGQQYGVKPGTPRTNARANLLMTAAYWKENAGILAKQIGRTPNSAETYMAHLLGPTAASRVIKAKGTRPAYQVARVSPGQNKKFFMKGSRKSGYKARTVSEFKSFVASEMRSHSRAYQQQAVLTAFEYSYSLGGSLG